MTLDEIKVEGFYWNRFDEHRDWTVVYVGRRAKNPKHPQHHLFIVDGVLRPIGSGLNIQPSLLGEFIGPIESPAR